MAIKQFYETYTINGSQEGEEIDFTAIHEYGLAGKIYLMTIRGNKDTIDEFSQTHYFELVDDRIVPLNQEQSQMLLAEIEKELDDNNVLNFVTLQFDQDPGPQRFQERTSYSIEVEGETKTFVALHNMADAGDSRVAFIYEDKCGNRMYEEVPQKFTIEANMVLQMFTQIRRMKP